MKFFKSFEIFPRWPWNILMREFCQFWKATYGYHHTLVSIRYFTAKYCSLLPVIRNLPSTFSSRTVFSIEIVLFTDFRPLEQIWSQVFDSNSRICQQIWLNRWRAPLPPQGLPVWVLWGTNPDRLVCNKLSATHPCRHWSYPNRKPLWVSLHRSETLEWNRSAHSCSKKQKTMTYPGPELRQPQSAAAIRIAFVPYSLTGLVELVDWSSPHWQIWLIDQFISLFYINSVTERNASLVMSMTFLILGCPVERKDKQTKYGYR